jgi:AmiR/NasT family two-component response regulator
MEPVHQATGMVMAQLGIGAEDALARLRGAAFGSGRTLLDMAIHIVVGRVELSL